MSDYEKHLTDILAFTALAVLSALVSGWAAWYVAVNQSPCKATHRTVAANTWRVTDIQPPHGPITYMISFPTDLVIPAGGMLIPDNVRIEIHGSEARVVLPDDVYLAIFGPVPFRLRRDLRLVRSNGCFVVLRRGLYTNLNIGLAATVALDDCTQKELPA